MNFYKTLGLKNSRIDVADALRGLAVAGIILYHSVEHFNMYDGNIVHVYTLGCDDWMADVLALLLSGKMYGIFALLFGLSFFIMNDNQQQRGNCFSGRLAWRMFLLAMLGIVNTAFFDGDILFSYAHLWTGSHPIELSSYQMALVGGCLPLYPTGRNLLPHFFYLCTRKQV